MILAVVALALSAVGVVTDSGFSDEPAITWGERVDGLRCRAVLLENPVHEGDHFRCAIQFDYQAPPGETRTRVLNPIKQEYRYTLHLREISSGLTYARQKTSFGPFEIGYGCDGPPVFPSLQSLSPDTVQIRALSEDGHAIPNGNYELVVAYENDGRTGVEPDPADDYRDNLWTGTLLAAPVSLVILPASMEEKTIFTNAGICLNGFNDRMNGGWLWSWSPIDSIPIRYVPRPGQYVGRMFQAASVDESGNESPICSGHGGDVMSYISSRWMESTGYPQGRILRVKTSIFETGMGGRFPGSSDSTIYRILWSATFEGIPGVTPECPP